MPEKNFPAGHVLERWHDGRRERLLVADFFGSTIRLCRYTLSLGGEWMADNQHVDLTRSALAALDALVQSR